MARGCGPPSIRCPRPVLSASPTLGLLGRPDTGSPSRTCDGVPRPGDDTPFGTTAHPRCGPQGPPSSGGSFEPHGPEGRGSPPSSIGGRFSPSPHGPLASGSLSASSPVSASG